MLEKDREKREKIFSYLLEAVQKVFPEDVLCFLIHGSMVKGGLIEGFSDLDVQVFLKESSFDEFDLKLEKCMKIQNLVGNLDAPQIGAQYLQMYFYNPNNMPDWYTPPIKGSYKILFGKLPKELDFSEENFKIRMIKSLKGLPAEVSTTIRSFADCLDKTVYRRTRLIATKIFPIMYSLLSYDLEHPNEIWAKTKFEALDLFCQKYENENISEFFNLIQLLAKDHNDLELMKQAFFVGVEFLKEAAKISEKIKI
ncbi:MAG: hypothetical protein KGD59_01605 [Candidatus Heimdallarchaeota archaeon]|nr:hypothetical protein [Candidatus Heimdallarchaeota archaeon]MBY8993216.1 hypothetical protein [Candidatus Heimdallarchaeota archaeon]